MIERPSHSKTLHVVSLLVACAPRPPHGATRTDDEGSDTSVEERRSAVAELANFLALLSVTIATHTPTRSGRQKVQLDAQDDPDHLRQQRWVHDPDPFNVNQFGHPYQGATMYGIARSTGHGFWTSLIFSDVGSFTWEMAGETDPPSINDLITTGQAGSLLGEALYRLSDLVIKDHPQGRHFWHDALAGLLSPPRAVNRLAFGDRYRNQLPDSAPATSWQVRIGATVDALAHDYSAPSTLLNRDAAAEFPMS
jgi:hypothetical protein